MIIILGDERQGVSLSYASVLCHLWIERILVQSLNVETNNIIFWLKSIRYFFLLQSI